MRTTLIATLLSIFSFPVWASNYFSKQETCLSKADLQQIQSHFTQLRSFTTDRADQVCKGQQIDEKWFEVARTILAMQRLNLTDQLQRDLEDDLTLKPVAQKDWWGYFSQRAKRFIIEPARCLSNPNTVAYVFPMMRGDIYLCPRFFQMDPASQIEVLMHEVRHFEGHGHVTCSQGNEQGSAGACDRDIKSGGSYAVSVQASVELSYVEQLAYEDRVLSEASAIYSVNNKFNSLPTVKSHDYVYLSNAQGEIHRAQAQDLSKTELVTTFDTPVRIYGNGQHFTIFPFDLSQKAYRISKDFKNQPSAIGAFANLYNDESEEERALYTGINYYGEGAIAKDDVLYTICGTGATSLSNFPFPGGTVRAILSLRKNSDNDETYILNEAGDLYDFKCDAKTGKITSTRQELSFPIDTVDSFSIARGHAFILNENGDLLRYNLNDQTIDSTELLVNQWLSATPLKVYGVFDTIVE